MIKRKKMEIKVGKNGSVGNLVVEDQSYTAFNAVKDKLNQALWQNFWKHTQQVAVGDKGSLDLHISWECTMNGRAPARPKAVIAAERAALAVRHNKRQEEREKWRREFDQRVINLRKRIKSQVDHAFAIGKSGTEPAAKYITCQHCDAPAAVLALGVLPHQTRLSWTKI